MPDTPTEEDSSSSSDENLETEGDIGEEKLESEEGEKLETEGPEGQPRKRGAEARINELLAKNKELAERLDKVEAKETIPMPPVTSPTLSAEALRAVDQLKKLGFVHKDELDAKVRSVEERVVLETEHARLKEVFNGQDGRPKYDPAEIEAYMRNKGIFDPEVAYKAKHEPELLDWHVKQASKKSKPYSAPPTAPSERGDQTITREKIAQMQGTPEWRTWYEANRDKILGLMAQGQLQ